MLRQSANLPFRRMSDSYDLPCSIVPIRRSLKQNKNIGSCQKFELNTRENSKIKERYCFESTFKTFGNCQQESQQWASNASKSGFKKNQVTKHSIKQKINIIRFSDLKKKPQETKKYCNLRYEQQIKTPCHYCENHSKRKAKFFINCLQKNQGQNTHYYCFECSINLSQMNFNIYSLSNSNQLQDREQFTLNKLISIKNKINERENQIKKQSNLEHVDQLIKETEQKYEHLSEQLEKIKNQEIMNLQMLKIKIFDQISEQQSKIQVLRRRVEYLIGQFGKFAKCQQQRCFGLEKKWQQIYDESMTKIKSQFNGICKMGSGQPIKIPIQLTLAQITKKLESLFSQTVHELSFQVQQQFQNQQQNSKNSQNLKKLSQYLFNQDRFNSTFGNKQNMVSGVELVFSESNSFYEQENVMTNI